MKTTSREGFTIVEVLVAIIVLSVGVMALVGSSGMVTRMIGEGGRVTNAMEVATRRMEMLRQAAASTSPRCTAGTFASGGPVTTNRISESWTVAATGVQSRQVVVTVTYRNNRGQRSQTLTSVIPCY